VIVTVGGIIVGTVSDAPVFASLPLLGCRRFFYGDGLAADWHCPGDAAGGVFHLHWVRLSRESSWRIREYRHELETDIRHLQRLVAGLFFISVGASIDFNHCFSNPS